MDNKLSLLVPQLSEQGHQLALEWIERRAKIFELLPQVAKYVRDFEAKEKTKGERKLSYSSLLKELSDSSLIQTFEQVRKRATYIAFQSARADIQSDLEYQERILDSMKKSVDLLDISPQLTIPRYVSQPNFHWLPYISDEPWEKKFIGAFWDLGLFIMGKTTPEDRDYKVGSKLMELLSQHLRKHISSWNPRKILDIGCSAGTSTLAIAREFPQAEVWGIDISESMVTYAHARAVILDTDIHYVQANGESTPFADASFDLIVSDILFHELPNRARKKVIQECSRLLSPGGVMAHMEGGTYMDPRDLFGYYMRESGIRCANEWYASTSRPDLLQHYITEADLETNDVLFSRIGSPSLLSGESVPGQIIIGGCKRD